MKKGSHCSELVKKKISDALKKTTKTGGRFTPGHKRNLGRKLSAEHRMKLSAAHIGIRKSETHRKNISLGKSLNKSHRWKDGRKLENGYMLIFCPTHPYKTIGDYVPEHRVVMEKHLGRVLHPAEVVHHINGIKHDNRIENLMLFENNFEHKMYERDRNLEPLQRLTNKIWRDVSAKFYVP